MNRAWNAASDQLTPRRPQPRLKEGTVVVVWLLTNAGGFVAGRFVVEITGEWFLGTIIIGALILSWQGIRQTWTVILYTAIAFGTWGMALPVFGSINLLAGLALGSLLGFLQWFALRRKVKLAESWIFANIVAWLTGLGLYRAISPTFNNWCIGSLVGGAVAGLITGLVIARLLQRSIRDELDEASVRDNDQNLVFADMSTPVLCMRLTFYSSRSGLLEVRVFLAGYLLKRDKSSKIESAQ
jgi:hypothetical protein